MTATIDIRELPARIEELLALAAAGQEVILSDGVALRARLVPVPPAERVAGLHAGTATVSPDFDAPLPDDFWAGGRNAGLSLHGE